MCFLIGPCLNISREEEEDDDDDGEKEKHDVWFPINDQWHCTAVISFLLVLGRSLEQQDKCFLCVWEKQYLSNAKRFGRYRPFLSSLVVTQPSASSLTFSWGGIF